MKSFLWQRRAVQMLAAAVALLAASPFTLVVAHVEAAARSRALGATVRPDGKQMGCATISLSPTDGAKIEGFVQSFLRQNPSWQPQSQGRKTGGRRSMLTASIRVYFHVIVQPGGTAEDGEILPWQITAQMNKLNQVFAGTGFSFVLGGTDRTVNAAWFNPPDGDTEQRYYEVFSRLLRKGTMKDLNVYVYNGNSLSGSTYPWVAPTNPTVDGVIVAYGAFAGGPISLWNEGARVAHEVGHWLGLYHTFEGFILPYTPNPAMSCNPKYGDRVADTPASSEPSWYCSGPSVDTCPDQPGLDPLNNYMNWVEDGCYSQWTAGQIARMWNMYGAYRYNK